ncbi:hypothetical protein N9D69_01720 [Flavobacteriales bacterium]|nr:hypothetical protein [Flavobacteriales bacterium]
MKKTTLLLVVSFFSMYTCYAQELDTIPKSTNKITIGLLQGGGSLVGLDFEQLITENIGISVGAGFLAYGVSIHYHIKPSITSSSLAINYMHQGIGDSYVQSIVGPSYVIRISKQFSGQIGMGGIVDKGPQFKEVYENKTEPNVLFIFSLGMYF